MSQFGSNSGSSGSMLSSNSGCCNLLINAIRLVISSFRSSRYSHRFTADGDKYESSPCVKARYICAVLLAIIGLSDMKYAEKSHIPSAVLCSTRLICFSISSSVFLTSWFTKFCVRASFFPIRTVTLDEREKFTPKFIPTFVAILCAFDAILPMVSVIDFPFVTVSASPFAAVSA